MMSISQRAVSSGFSRGVAVNLLTEKIARIGGRCSLNSFFGCSTNRRNQVWGDSRNPLIVVLAFSASLGLFDRISLVSCTRSW